MHWQLAKLLAKPLLKRNDYKKGRSEERSFFIVREMLLSDFAKAA